MDQARGKQQHSYKAYKSTSPHNRHYENNHSNTASSHGIFRARIQRHSLKWRKDHYHKGNYRSRLPYRKSDINSRKSNKTAEDVEEEERKKKLTDTAMKLLSKLKTWNAEKSHSEDDPQQNCNINEVVNESSCKNNEEKINTEGKPKRIAHSKKTKLVKSRTRKSFNQPAKTKTRYDVNKETVKDFQNRIQHKLIEEIMQMPKENLQNVINDPKINPIMELKMSRLVKENRPLIAQKLRALAESKMKSLDYSTNSQLLIDIDKLIDPVIETDLSVLPYELIKQMENIFQVQFDYSQNSKLSQVEADVCESVIDNVVTVEDVEMEINNIQQVVKVENTEDLSIYECSTDEDEEISASKYVESEQKHDSNLLDEILTQGEEELEKMPQENIRRKSSKCSESIRTNTDTSLIKVNVNEGEKYPQKENIPFVENCLITERVTSNNSIPKEPHINNLRSMVEFASKNCQTDYNYKNATTQTQTITEGVETLYGVPIPEEATDESVSSLLNEVNLIQNLANKLNERRLMIFLQLARMSPSGSFITDDAIRKNFIETLSNGNFCLLESLKQFFSVHQQENKHSEHISSERSYSAPEQWKSKNNSRNREDKKSSSRT